MLSKEDYVQLSLMFNLFWLRIMKEHAVFIEATMPPPGKALAQKADSYKQYYDRHLSTAIHLANGAIPSNVLQSGQFYTKYTEEAEGQAQKYTDISINRNLTRMTYRIAPYYKGAAVTGKQEQDIASLNKNILSLTNTFISFQENLLNSRSSCSVFTMMYTADIDHVLLEAKKYREILSRLQNREPIDLQSYKLFWTQNMAGHAKVMRGELDPTETANFKLANEFANQFDALAKAMSTAENASLGGELLTSTQAISQFKANTTQGIIACQIQAIMLALYTDHLLREANHFLFLLQQ